MVWEWGYEGWSGATAVRRCSTQTQRSDAATSRTPTITGAPAGDGMFFTDVFHVSYERSTVPGKYRRKRVAQRYPLRTSQREDDTTALKLPVDLNGSVAILIRRSRPLLLFTSYTSSTFIYLRKASHWPESCRFNSRLTRIQGRHNSRARRRASFPHPTCPSRNKWYS